MLESREDAARLLLKRLLKFKGQNPLVLGIPRGAMPMAKIIAEGLNGELGAVLIHKIPAPYQRELAIGSVGLSGKIFRLPMLDAYEVSDSYIERESKKQIETLQRRKSMFNLPDLNCNDRIVIIVDDGIATGATAIGAIQEVREQKPKRLIFAAGVVARSTAATIRSMVDEFIVEEEPDGFFAVSQFFVDFSEVTDEDVVALLKTGPKERAPEASL
nr:phosphoribosyltransferase family protein [Bdellovibrio sp. CKG001]BFD66045.1 phosphoribosyltransferase family protein [Bdellovibrio sp. HAGR004]